jgi:hypothetical protein
MSIRVNSSTAVLGLLVVGWSEQCFAQSKSRFHLGLDAPILESYSYDGTASVSSGLSSSAETKLDTKSSDTRFGVPNSAALSLGVLINDHVDLGARIAFFSGSHEETHEFGKAKSEVSNFSLNPYIAYLFGSYQNRARFFVGATAGFGTGTGKTTLESSDSDMSDDVSKQTTNTTQLGAFFGLRGFVSDSVSMDPSVTLLKTSQTIEYDNSFLKKNELSGLSAMLNLGISVWFGGRPQTVVEATPVEAPAPATNDQSDDAALAKAIAEQPGLTTDRITLAVGEGRAITVIVTSTQPNQPAQLIFRETNAVSGLSACGGISMHVLSAEDTAIATSPGKLSGPTGEIATIKGEVPFEKLSTLVASPLVNAVMPDHWFDVCGSRWFIYEVERSRLLKFIKARRAVLPSAVAPVVVEPVAPADTATAPETLPNTEATPATEASTNENGATDASKASKASKAPIPAKNAASGKTAVQGSASTTNKTSTKAPTSTNSPVPPPSPNPTKIPSGTQPSTPAP